MWDIDYYETASGECPARDFLEGLNKKSELPFAIRRLDLLEEFGNQLRRPIAAPLTDGIYELRIPVQRKQFRLLYFFFFQDSIIISHGLKKEGKVPPAEIEKAKRHRTDYFSRHERKK
jgi:phage-related protein